MTLVDVQTGEVKVVHGHGILSTNAIGSCIAVIAFDKFQRRAGLAHVMLPGRSPPDSPEPLRFAENAVDELLAQMQQDGSDKKEVQFCLVGAANVLERPDDTICQANIASVTAALRRHGQMILARALGGVLRRRARIDVAGASVYVGEGDEPERLLWRWCRTDVHTRTVVPPR